MMNKLTELNILQNENVQGTGDYNCLNSLSDMTTSEDLHR